MNESSPAAPLWRRFAAAVYDAPLLVFIWIVVAALFATIQLAVPAWLPSPVLRATTGLAAGAVFFGWFWTRGGQSPGMRAWHIRLQRLDGAPLRWPVAALRYGVMLAVWALVIATPLLLWMAWKFGGSQADVARYPHIAALLARARDLSLLATSAVAALLIVRRLDPRSRLPHDLISSVTVVRLVR